MPELDRRGFIAASSIAATLVAAPPLAAQGTAGAVRSISAMSFAPDGKLVVADWRGGALHVLELPAAPAAGEERAFNLTDLDAALAKASPAGRTRATALAFDAPAAAR